MTLTQENRSYVVRCDNCERQYQVHAPAYTEKQFRQLIAGIGWTLDTEHGDLCAQCARSWRDERSHA